jgi:hypothetical protein
MSRASYVSILGAFALTVLATIVNVACTSDVTGQDQGISESNVSGRHGYGNGNGYGYGYGSHGAAQNVADDRAY